VNTNYQALIPKHIFIGGVDDIEEMMNNEQVDVIYDLRAESPVEESSYIRVHFPIVDDTDHQDESVKYAINQVVKSFKGGKKVYFHCSSGRNRTGAVAIGVLLELKEAGTIEEAEQKVKSIRNQIKVKSEMKEVLKRLYPNA
jgi:thioredoxin reductase (NADPH)